MKGKYRNFLNTLCILGLLLDSGGGLGVRNISFLIILGFAFLGIYRNVAINKTFIVIFSLFFVSLLPGVYISLNSKLPVSDVLVWIVSFLLIPLLYFYIKGSKLNIGSFVNAGLVFSLVIVFLFFGRLYNFPLAVALNDYISSHSNGFFQNKGYVTGDLLPNVYFQGTLGLIICGAASLHARRYFVFVFVLIALILAPSRFGFIVLFAWAAFLFFRSSPVRLVYLPFILLGLYLALDNLPFGAELFSVFNGQSDAGEIRNGHLISIYETLSKDIPGIFFGQGPGSVFFTKGFNDYTDNVEISQIEYIRKYGIFSFLAFNLFYFWPLLSKKPHLFSLKGALVVYYIVSFSNPVLFSILSMLFVAFVYIEIGETDIQLEKSL